MVLFLRTKHVMLSSHSSSLLLLASRISNSHFGLRGVLNASLYPLLLAVNMVFAFVFLVVLVETVLVETRIRYHRRTDWVLRFL